MVCDLMAIKRKLYTQNQRDFVEGLYNLLDEFSPFLEQQSEAQLDYLYSLYKKHQRDLKR